MQSHVVCLQVELNGRATQADSYTVARPTPTESTTKHTHGKHTAKPRTLHDERARASSARTHTHTNIHTQSHAHAAHHHTSLHLRWASMLFLVSHHFSSRVHRDSALHCERHTRSKPETTLLCLSVCVRARVRDRLYVRDSFRRYKTGEAR